MAYEYEPEFIGLPEVKAHLRIGHDAEDNLLSLYLLAAIDHVRAFTRRDYDSWEQPVPPAVNAAVLLLVADLYENREAQGAAALHENRTVERLLWPYRVFG